MYAGTTYRVRELLAEPLALNANLGRYTNFVNLLDMSAIARPTGFRDNATGFGVSLIGPAWADRALLDLARRYEEIAPMPQTPPLDLAGVKSTVKLAVVGAHLGGMPLHWQLTSRDAAIVRGCAVPLEQWRTGPDWSCRSARRRCPADAGPRRGLGWMIDEGGQAAVAGRPETSMLSLTANGTPARGRIPPAAARRSISRARASTASADTRSIHTAGYMVSQVAIGARDSVATAPCRPELTSAAIFVTLGRSKSIRLVPVQSGQPPARRAVPPEHRWRSQCPRPDYGSPPRPSWPR